MAGPAGSPTELVARGYQDEMYERSMKGNVIVVLETGSGKTLIAALRIKAELERCRPDQLVWFLCPGVDLCKQQHDFLSRYLPSVRTRLLIGSDNMDRWGQQRIWDAALDQVRLVVSTHAVLCQALEHSFVNLSRLALLVFDEAHHCEKKHPANRIMQSFYHISKAEDTSSVPHILGLSASPTPSDLKKMHKVESNLDAVAVTPRVYRQELGLHVNRPVCHLLEYNPDYKRIPPGTAHRALTEHVRAASDVDNKGTTRVVSRFHARAEHILEVLGPWAADCFIVCTIESLMHLNEGSDSVLSRTSPRDVRPLIAMWKQPSFREFFDAGPQGNLFCLSAKAALLVQYLAARPVGTTKCLIFVERRDMTHVLSWLLSAHPATGQHFRCRPYVGTSSNVARRPGLEDLMNVKEQRDVLAKFRADAIDVLISTNALEEGIDVQSCNLVICFDPPANLRSFVQRRGRARQQKSTLVLLTPSDGSGSKVRRWQELEAEMLRMCQQDRELQPRQEDKEEDLRLELLHPKTGAVIHEDNVVAHLYHFCSLLPQHDYQDLRPDFTYQKSSLGLITANVKLPDCIHIANRDFEGTKGWRTEDAARKDAAFRAYSALYQAELLNEHLLPLSQDWTPFVDSVHIESGQREVRPQCQVWQSTHQAVRSDALFQTPMTIRAGSNNLLVSTSLTTMVDLSKVSTLDVRGFGDEPCHVHFGSSTEKEGLSQIDTAQQQYMADMFRSTRSYRLSFEPESLLCTMTPPQDTKVTQRAVCELSITAEDAYAKARLLPFVVRAPLPNRPVYLARSWVVTVGQPLKIVCTGLARTGGSYQVLSGEESALRSPSTFLASQCTIIDASHVVILSSILLAPIFTHISDFLAARRLREDCLTGIPYRDLTHTVEAIRAPAADRENNYQRLEFVGDCMLKFVASKHLYAAQPSWHEGYLTKRRSHLISNERLAAESLKVGIDRYIITNQAHYRDWIPPTRQDKPASPRYLSTKVLADVVEALIGSVVVDTDGDMAAVRACINRLIPDLPQTDPYLPQRPPLLFEATRFLKSLEDLIGYSFKNKIVLLEAVTLSSSGSTMPTESYQRLEFLGDAVLDLLVTNLMLQHQPPLSQGQMTRTRAAMVNSHLLGYLCLRFNRITEAETVITEGLARDFYIGKKSHITTIWKFMRHRSEGIMVAQADCQERFELYKVAIEVGLEGTKYPWVELASIRPSKFFSDLVESILGAIFVDSAGNLASCRDFLEEIGLLTHIRHALKHTTDLAHPRDTLQRLAGSESVDFGVHETEDKSWSGSLSVGDRTLAHVDNRETQELAILELCLEGVQAMNLRKRKHQMDPDMEA